MPDAITSLRDDHRRVEKLFKEFEKLEKNDGTPRQKRKVVEQIVSELSVHATVEEQVFYPTVRAEVPDVGDTVLEGLEEHHIVKWTLNELAGMAGDEERFDPKVTVLIESVRHHVEEEEGEMFPAIRDALGRKRLIELYDAMEACRAKAPTEPRPMAPDEPPGEQPVIDLTQGQDDGKARGLLGKRRAGAKAGSRS